MLPDGSIHHLKPPEYHADTDSDVGILSFRSFGWKILDEIRGSRVLAGDGDISAESAKRVYDAGQSDRCGGTVSAQEQSLLGDQMGFGETGLGSARRAGASQWCPALYRKAVCLLFPEACFRDPRALRGPAALASHDRGIVHRGRVEGETELLLPPTSRNRTSSPMQSAFIFPHWRPGTTPRL